MNSAQSWLIKHSILVNSYINQIYQLGEIGYEDKQYMFDEFMNNSGEAKSIIKDYITPNKDKIQEILDFIMYNPVVIIGILAGQRMGKDALADFLLFNLKRIYGDKIRIVTLGNFIKPPYVQENDMYFSLTKCPIGTKQQNVIIYCSELDLFFPARNFKGDENTTLNLQINTLAQNKQKIIGCAKLGYNVDVSFWRACTMKLFKYISEENLKHERMEFLSSLGMKLKPNDPNDKTQVLAIYNDALVKFKHHLSPHYGDEMSEQFSNISEDKMRDYVETLLGQGMDPKQIKKTFMQTYRFDKPIEWYHNLT